MPKKGYNDKIINLFMTDTDNENKGKYFRIHIDEHEEVKAKTKPLEEKKIPQKKTVTSEKRSFKDIFEDGISQIVASFVILVIGFFLLNYSAYIKIFESKWNTLTGNEEISPLTEIAEIDTDVTYDREVLVYTQEVLDVLQLTKFGLICMYIDQVINVNMVTNVSLFFFTNSLRYLPRNSNFSTTVSAMALKFGHNIAR